MGWISLFTALCIAVGGAFTLAGLGPVFGRLLSGDGNAALEAASALLVVWSITVTVGVAAVGATIKDSPLETSWKLWLLRTRFAKIFLTYACLCAVAGIVPYVCLLETDTTIPLSRSSLGPWLVIGGLLQFALITAAGVLVFYVQKQLGLLVAVEHTLDGIDERLLLVLQRAQAVAFKEDFVDRNRAALMPMSGFARGLLGPALEVHERLLTLLTAVLTAKNTQVVDAGIRRIAAWAHGKRLSAVDTYFQSSLVPSVIHLMRTGDDFWVAPVFRARLYYFALVMEALGENGATLTGSNVANPIWELIQDFAAFSKMSNALRYAEMAIQVLLRRDFERAGSYSILLNNLCNGIPNLLAERSGEALYWVGNILEWQWSNVRRSVSPENAGGLRYMLAAVLHIYTDIDEQYGVEVPLWGRMHDLRYWVLITTRRAQEWYVDAFPPASLTKSGTAIAHEAFEQFEQAMTDMLEIRVPSGDPASYMPVKLPANPYVVAAVS